MKKITLKITTFLLLTMFAFQVQGQIDPTKMYTIRNAATGNYMGISDDTSYFVPTPDYTTADQNFTFVATTYSGTPHTNIVSASKNGSMRNGGAGTGWKIFNTTKAAPTADNADPDKVWNLVEVDLTDFGFGMQYRFTSRTGTRYLYEVDATTSPADDLQYITSDVIDDRSLWLVQEATLFPLSAEDFDTSSIFISNPVNNQLSIKGLPSNVKQVSIYSLLGQEVLTKKVDAQPSLTIDISTLKSGMYLVEMKGDNGAFTKKIVKE